MNNEEKLANKEQKHVERQKRIKAEVAERVAQATEERGVLVVITGNGKGKSTSGFGTVTRHWPWPTSGYCAVY